MYQTLAFISKFSWLAGGIPRFEQVEPVLKDTHYKHREACVELNCGQNEIIRVFELRHDKENRGVRNVKTERQVGQAPNEDEPLAVTERMLVI